jgi:hypothetical protein
MLNRGEAAGFSTISSVSSCSIYAYVLETPVATYRNKLPITGVTCDNHETCPIVDFLPWRANES